VIVFNIGIHYRKKLNWLFLTVRLTVFAQIVDGTLQQCSCLDSFMPLPAAKLESENAVNGGRILHDASVRVYVDVIDSYNSYTSFIVHSIKFSLSLIPSSQYHLVKVPAALVARGLQHLGQWGELVFEIEGRPTHPD
jgi:hypothetical protein